MNKKTQESKTIIGCLASAMLLCSIPLAATAQVEITTMPEQKSLQEMVDYAKTLQRRPYRTGATGPYAFDCSGFTLHCYKKLGITLDRTSAQQAKQGKKIRNRKHLKPGDLVCFNGSKIDRNVGHVGIVVETDGKEFQFIHASSSKGIMISSSETEYYDERYITGRRITADKRLRRAIKKLEKAKEDSIAIANGLPVQEPTISEEGTEHKKDKKNRHQKTEKENEGHKTPTETKPGPKDTPVTPAQPADKTTTKEDSTKVEPAKVVKDALGGQYHTVVKGDTLYNIAKRTGCTVQQLQEWNNLKDNALSIGQKLKVKE